MAYYTPTFRPRLKPKLGFKPTIHGITSTRVKPRILPTPVGGLSGKVKVSSGGAKLNLPGAKSGTGSSSLAKLTAINTNRIRKPNPKPKSPRRLTGYKSTARLTGLRTHPRSVAVAPRTLFAKQPGTHPLQNAKKSVGHSTPKLPSLHL